MGQPVIINEEAYMAALAAIEERGATATYQAIIDELGGGSRSTIARIKRQLERVSVEISPVDYSLPPVSDDIPPPLAKALAATHDSITALGRQVGFLVRSAVLDERRRYELLLHDERERSEGSLLAETLRADIARDEADGLLAELDTVQAERDASLLRVGTVVRENEASMLELAAVKNERNNLRLDLDDLQRRLSEAEGREVQILDDLGRSRHQLEKAQEEYRSLSEDLVSARLAQARAEEKRDAVETHASNDRAKLEWEIRNLRQVLIGERETSDSLRDAMVKAGTMHEWLEKTMAETEDLASEAVARLTRKKAIELD